MLITEHFVMLNYPKTGSSFAREIIKYAYHRNATILQRSLKKLRLFKDPVTEHYVVNPQVNIPDQHGKLADIPDQHRHKQVVSIVRCPFDRYLSQYTYRWWVKHPPASLDLITQCYPHFPALTFDEFYEVNWRWMLPKRLAQFELPDIEVGTQTLQFIEFFFANPPEAAKRILLDREPAYLAQLKAIVFLHQEHLNTELMAFLQQTTSIAEADLAFITKQQPINVSRNKGIDAMLISSATREKIRQRDWLLFELFPEYNV